MSRPFSAVADSDESVIDPSTAPTTPDGSMSFSPVLQPAQLLDAFDGRTGVQTRPGRGSSATLDLDGTAPMVVKNICCVGAGYVGELRRNCVSFISPSHGDQGPAKRRKLNAAASKPALKPRERPFSYRVEGGAITILPTEAASHLC